MNVVYGDGSEGGVKREQTSITAVKTCSALPSLEAGAKKGVIMPRRREPMSRLRSV